MFARGLTAGSSGNISARLPDGFLITPTNSCLGFLDPARLSKLDARRARIVSGDRADQGDAAAHRLLRGAAAGGRRRAPALDLCDGAVVPRRHRSGRRHPADHALCGHARRPGAALPLHPARRGRGRAADRGQAAGRRRCCSPTTARWCRRGRFRDAVFAAEELEETAKLVLLTRGMQVRRLSAEQVAALAPRRRLSPT